MTGNRMNANSENWQCVKAVKSSWPQDFEQLASNKLSWPKWRHAPVFWRNILHFNTLSVLYFLIQNQRDEIISYLNPFSAVSRQFWIRKYMQYGLELHSLKLYGLCWCTVSNWNSLRYTNLYSENLKLHGFLMTLVSPLTLLSNSSCTNFQLDNCNMDNID